MHRKETSDVLCKMDIDNDCYQINILFDEFVFRTWPLSPNWFEVTIVDLYWWSIEDYFGNSQCHELNLRSLSSFSNIFPLWCRTILILSHVYSKAGWMGMLHRLWSKEIHCLEKKSIYFVAVLWVNYSVQLSVADRFEERYVYGRRCWP